jgi:hypothetical protein
VRAGQTDYTPVFDDWLWHFMLPFAAYATLAAAGFIASVHAGGALFAVAAATALLLFAGIHNAWDTVTFLAMERARRKKAAHEQAGRGKPTARTRPNLASLVLVHREPDIALRRHRPDRRVERQQIASRIKVGDWNRKPETERAVGIAERHQGDRAQRD